MRPSEMLEQGEFRRSVAGQDFDAICQAYGLAFAKPHAGLMLIGVTGCGKSHAIKALFPSTRTIYCQSAERVRSLMPTDESPKFKYVCETRDIVLDDLGSELLFNEYGVIRNIMGEWLEAWHFERVDRRRGGRLFVSTNLAADELLKRYGARVFDRLMSIVVVCQMTGRSKRGAV